VLIFIGHGPPAYATARQGNRSSPGLSGCFPPTVEPLVKVMPFILKTDALSDAAEGQQVEVTEPAYYGGHAIAAGDQVFVWFSGAVQRLAWSGEVLRVSPPIGHRIPVVIRLVASARSDAP
jgi:hypothetical protein